MSIYRSSFCHSLRRGSAPPSALSADIISEQEILQSAVTATSGGYLAVGTGHMTGIRKNSQPDLRKSSSNNGPIVRGKGHEKSGGISFLGLNVGGTKSRSSSVPRGSVSYHVVICVCVCVCKKVDP